MLLRLLRTYLAPYRPWLSVIVVLQFISTVAMLFLPSINADIIDNGVATRRHRLHLRLGAVMLGVSLVQIVLLGGRGLVRGPHGDGVRPRPALGGVPHRCRRSPGVRSRTFGAPSLITRNTNDIQQVQMLALMTCTMAVSVPIMMVGGVVMAMREDLGLSWLLVDRGADAVPVRRPRRLADGAELPAGAGADRRGQPGAARADHRHPRGPRVRARAAGDQALRQGQRRADRGLGPGRSLDGHDVPAGDAGRERLQRRRDLVRRPPRRRRRACRSAR